MNLEEKQQLISADSSSVSVIFFASLAHSFFCVGLSASITGPTLLNLEAQTHSTIDVLSYIFFVRNLGSMIGNIFAGFIMRKYSRWAKSCFTTALFLMSLAFLSNTFITNLSLLISIQSVYGVAMGMVDNFGQVLLLKDCNKDKVGPYLHGLHFALGE